MDVQPSDQHYQVLHVDSKSLLRWNAPLKLNGRDNDHPNIPDDTGGKHQSKLIAWSDRFVVDRNRKYDNPETDVLRYYISFNLEISTIHSNYHTAFPLEYRDEGAYFYRKHFLLLRDKHQNWFGIQSNGEAVAVSVARVLLPKGNKHDNIYPILAGGPPLPVVERPLSGHNCFIQMNSPKLTSGELRAVPNDPREIANGSGSNSVQRNRSRDKKASEKESEIGLVPAWLVIVRREKGCDLRCCVIDQSPEDNKLQRGSSAGSNTYVTELQRASAAEVKKAGQKTSGLSRTNGKKNNYAKTVITMDPHTQAMLKFVTLGQINPEELQLGEANTAVYGKLASMDELELLEQHKFGVLLCTAHQSTEVEMYNNEHSTSAFETFLELLGRRVPLQNYSGYAAGLDTKTNTTGLETYVSEFHGFPVTFLVSTMLPFHKTAVEQVGRKRHVGNSSVTFIFQEPDALPFAVDSVVSRFQQVFIVVRSVKSTDATPKYRVAVCQARGVPPFGPILDENHVYEHGPEFANLLLEKACNAANASLQSEKFQAMILRSRVDYLRQFANEHSWCSPVTRIDERKSSPFRALGRKRNATTTVPVYPFSDPDIQLDMTGDYSDATGSKSRQSSQISLANSSVQLRKPRARRLFREKTVDGTSQTRNTVNLSEESSPNIVARTPTVLSLNCSDFGHTFCIHLLDVHTLCGRLSANQLYAHNIIQSNASHESDHNSQLVALTLSKEWLVLTTLPIRTSTGVPFPQSSQTKSAAKILLAVPTRSIFAYSFQSNHKLMTLFLEFGQYLRLQSPDALASAGSGENVCQIIYHFLLDVLPTGMLIEITERTLRWTGNTETPYPNNSHGSLDKKPGLAQQRRKSNHGKRCALTDLGVHISFTRIYADRDKEREAIRFPCIFKIDEDSPAHRAGLHRGQIMLRIGSHEIVDLFRAAMCILAKNDRDEKTYNPFSLTCPFIRPEAHLAADLLNLIRQLRFSQDIAFAVGMISVNSTDPGPSKPLRGAISISSSPQTNRISFPYLRRPTTSSLAQPKAPRSMLRDSTISVTTNHNAPDGSTVANEAYVHTPRRLSTGTGFGAEEFAPNNTTPSSNKSKSRRTTLTPQHSWHLETPKAIISASRRRTHCYEIPSLDTIDDVSRSRLQEAQHSVRWSFGALAASDNWTDLIDDNESPTPTAPARSIAYWNMNSINNSDDSPAEVAYIKEKVKKSSKFNGDRSELVRPLPKYHKKLSTQGSQINRAEVLPLVRTRGRSMLSRSNPQLYSPADSITPPLQQNRSVRGGLRCSPDSLLALNSTSKTQQPGPQKSPNESPVSQHSLDSERLIPNNPLALDRRSRLEKENTKSSIWFPMRASPTYQMKRATNEKTMEGTPQVPPRAMHWISVFDRAVTREHSSNHTTTLNREMFSNDNDLKGSGTGNRSMPSNPLQHNHSETDMHGSEQLWMDSHAPLKDNAAADALGLQLRVQQLEKQLHLEQRRRSQMVSMCASLLEENRHLRFGCADGLESRRTVTNANGIPTTTDSGPRKLGTPTRTVPSKAHGTVNFLPKFNSETDI